MREIKFRVWDEVSKTMDYDYSVNTDWGSLSLNELLSGVQYDDDIRKPIFMQYTGLKDKNGKEIYEGDILSFRDGIAPVEYLFTEFVAMDVTGHGNCNLLDDRCEVIGNIYENPDLLKGDK